MEDAKSNPQILSPTPGRASQLSMNNVDSVEELKLIRQPYDIRYSHIMVTYLQIA